MRHHVGELPTKVIQPEGKDLSSARRHETSAPILAPQRRLFLNIEEAICKAGGRPVCRRVKQGGRLFSAGDAFKCLYPIRSGVYKTSLIDREGREQVTGFFMRGEILGMDGLCNGHYENSATALEDSEVHVVPYTLIEEIGREFPLVQRRLYALFSTEITRSHAMMMLLGTRDAKGRLAAFLTNLSERLQHRGCPKSDLLLRMTRQEIGSYLGLKLETVSRAFSALHKDGLIDVQNKHINILDIKRLACVGDARV